LILSGTILVFAINSPLVSLFSNLILSCNMFGTRPREHLVKDSESELSDSASFSSKLRRSNLTNIWKTPSLNPEYDYPAALLPGNLRRTTAWIRNILEPKVAYEGPDALLSDDVLTIHTTLLALQDHHLSRYVLRFSRIHLAVATICGRATRWPSKLIEEADRVIAHFELLFGSLKHVKVPIFELDGRLYGICAPSDITRNVSNSQCFWSEFLRHQYRINISILLHTPQRI
jgi:hypothetical protein